MWFTESNVGRIGRIDLSKHPFKITEYALAHRNDGPLGIALGADGALWFAENGGIGRITTAHQISFYRDDTYTYGTPHYITAGPDGALWFTTYYGKDLDYVGRIDPYTHKFSHPTEDPSLGPITQRGADLWVAGEPTRYSGNYYGYVYAINAQTHHRYKPVYLGGESDPNGIALGSDCNLWVTDPALDRIWYVTPSDKC